MKKSELGWLRSKIADLAAQGVAIRKQIQAAFARARYDLWNDKRSIGDEARWMLLAYAFLRDVPYRVVEPTAVHEGSVYGGAKGLANAVAKAAQLPDSAKVEAWIAVPEQIDRKTRREAAEIRGQVARRSRLKKAAWERHGYEVAK